MPRPRGPACPRRTPRPLNAALDAIVESLAKEDKVQLVGFGAFEVRRRAARKGRNPRAKEGEPR